MILTIDQILPTNSGSFIVLEGVNGAGKSTLQKELAKLVNQNGKTALCSHEPGGTELGLALRNILLSINSSKRSALSEALLFSADRAQHIEEIIKPALDRKETVILDRYYYSTIAFQGFGRGLDVSKLLELSEMATSGLKPDLVILLDLDPKEGLKRNTDKNQEDSFEEEEINFHHRIRDGFIQLAKTLPEPFIILDASLPSQTIIEMASLAVSRVISSKGA